MTPFVQNKIEVQESGIHGHGLITTEDIKAGEIICGLNGTIKSKRNRTRLEADTEPNWIVVERGLSVDPDHYYRHLNHSCDPTASFKNDSLFLVALKDLPKGSEVTVDYAVTEDNRYWSMPCACGAANCRQVVRSIQYLPESTFNKYMPYVPNYFQKVFRRYQSYLRAKTKKDLIPNEEAIVS